MEEKESLERQFQQAYDKYAQAIFRYCYWRVFDRDKAQDVMQETFCRTWKYLSEGKTIETMQAFLYRIANNIIIDESRKKKAVSLNDIMEKGFSPSIDEREKKQQYFAHKEALEVIYLLDEKYREAILLKYVEGLSAREISEVTGESEDNIYIRIHRGLQKVRDILNKGKNHEN